MKLKQILLVAMTTALTVNVTAQTPVAHFDMSLHEGKIVEQVTNTAYSVSSQLSACTGTGLDGQALRFDGYSNYVKADIPVHLLSKEALTLSVVLAAETYPMMKVDEAENTPTYGTICGNLEGKAGFALQLSSQGDLRFQFGSTYANGYLFTIEGTKKLPRGKWSNVTAVLDKAGNSAKLYLNGEEIGSSRMSRSDILHSNANFFIGKDATDLKSGPFLINTFCGLIDDIRISNEVTDFSLIDPIDYSALPYPDFNYPSYRYTNEASSGAVGGTFPSLWRPLFHGMPSGSWTNESHGLIYSGGRYHVFFQKNANGPYMSRLHWGHISSENLYDWREEPIAFGPDQAYDIKGCWSGCVYEDEGDTYILYTAVDNAKATIAQAKAKDSGLVEWEKQGIIINGRPSGLSDDFRDPYFFTANGQKYIIVGTSKNGIGACTLHKYQNGSWTNDGTIFFQGGNANQHGTFWEMPNVTDMGNGKWLFTCTPLNTGVGVRTLCWVGTIGADGKFVPDGNGVQYLEMGGISRDGFGLLSPSILSPLTPHPSPILLGIVPDKLPTQTNYEMGWAHNFSLPRELSLDANGQLVQKPYDGLKAMRTGTTVTKELTLLGSESLIPVSGRQIELLGEFTIGGGICGFHFLKNGDKQAALSYDPATGVLTLDYTSLARVSTDDGTWSVRLPNRVNAGETLRLHAFLDGSIVDIFVNDTWAYSVRIFPTDTSAIEVEAFATASTPAKVSAWILDAKNSADGILPITWRGSNRIGQDEFPTDVIYDLQGRRAASASGIHIREGRKYIK